jgi:hypothetical protein
MAAVLVLALMGCAPWASIPPPAPAMLPATTRLKVWIHGRGLVLSEVNISADSVRGRVVEPSDGTAWVAVARSAVDSFQIRTRDTANWFGVGFAGGVLVGVGGILALIRSAESW